MSRSNAMFALPKGGQLRYVPERGRPYAESLENGMHALRHLYASVLPEAGGSNRSSPST
ncbi:hypothetical protein ACFXIY_31005 [Streptomyces albidoflavus]